MLRLVLLLALNVTLAGCQLFAPVSDAPATDDAIGSSNDSAMMDSDKSSDDSMGDDKATMEVPADVAMVAYENKAVGYTIQRPATWYWQHDILTRGDRFAADRKPLALTEGDTLSIGISIYVWLQNDTPSFDASGYKQSSATVAGVDATKYVGTRRIPGSDYDQHITVYEFDNAGRIYRLQFVSATKDNPDLKVFEAVVESFSLNR